MITILEHFPLSLCPPHCHSLSHSTQTAAVDNEMNILKNEKMTEKKILKQINNNAALTVHQEDRIQIILQNMNGIISQIQKYEMRNMM